MKNRITFGVLGSTAVYRDNGVVEYPTGREARILTAFLCSLGTPVATQELVDIVWSENAPSSPDTALHNVVYRLRRFLTDCGVEYVIEKQATGYVLKIDPSRVDAVRFEQLVASAESAKRGHAQPLLCEALELWRGEPFAGHANGIKFFRGEAERLEALRWVAIENRIECDLAAGRHRELIPELIGMTIQSPIHENIWAYLMTALYLSQQRGRALRVYRRARGFLTNELGIEPSRSLRELEGAIVDQDDERVRSLAISVR